MAKKKVKKHTYKKGEDLGRIAKELTGYSFLIYRLLNHNGYSLTNLPDGAILKWER